jgi:hypothetical protein
MVDQAADYPVLSKTDDDLLEHIFATLKERAGGDPYDEDGAYVAVIRALPIGLRAMAATHWLDVSLTVDDIGWHFLNFGEEGLVRETTLGLRELSLPEFEAAFVAASELICPIRTEVTDDNFYEYLDSHNLDSKIQELGERIDESASRYPQMTGSAIYGAWITYTRAHPENVFDSAS